MDGNIGDQSENLIRPRACERCARSKAKCVWTDQEKDGMKVCERCYKGHLTCIAPPSGTRKTRGKSTRVKAIEKKLEGIMSLLGEHKDLLQHVNKTSGPSGSQLQTAAPRPPTSDWSIPRLENDRIQVTQPTLPSSFTQQLNSRETQTFEIISGYEMSFDEADQVLQEYMIMMLPQFPFVPLETTDVFQLSREKPLLLKTLLFVCRPSDSQSRLNFDEWFRQHIAHQIVVLNMKNIEILQAIMIFLAWRDFRHFIDGLHTSLMQLAVGLISEMKLDRCPQLPKKLINSIVEDVEMLGFEVPVQEGPLNVGRRTALGIFYIATSASLLLSKSSCMRYNQTFERFSQVLLHDREYPTDMLLVQLVKIQIVASKLIAAYTNTSGDGVYEQSFHSMTVSLIRKELDDFASQLPPELASNRDRDWDARVAEKEVNIEDLIQRLSDFFRAGSLVMGPRRRIIDQSQDILAQYADRLGMLKIWCSLYLSGNAINPVGSGEQMADSNINFGLEGNLAFWQMFVDGSS
uniref:Zn(2)-C6 fungal-type domain-containing protein n=1 Tax=Bionectria ochroleuca TaxID=29856 RepID=A0A8H7NHR4_BIOOC